MSSTCRTLFAVTVCAFALDAAAMPSTDAEGESSGKRKKRRREPTHWIIEQDGYHEDRQLDLLGNLAVLGSATGGGLAIWVSFPVAPDGFIPDVNDEFSLEVGSYFQYYSWSERQTFLGETLECSQNWWVVAPLVGVRWSFYLTEAWRIYPKLKMGYGIGLGDKYKCEYSGAGTITKEIGGPAVSHFGWEVGLGAYWRFNPTMSLRMELTNFGPAAGLSVDF